MAEFTITTNADAVAGVLENINDQVRLGIPSLFKQVGPKLIEDTRNRIRSQDEGKWAKMSKWTKAKKNPERVLQGAEEFVKFKLVGQTGAQLYGDTGKDWTLTQHHEGFENEENHKEGDKVVIDIINPGPLGLGSVPDGKFSWVPKRGAGRTPARKIWPTEGEAFTVVSPIASRWLEVLVQKATEKSV